MKPVSIDASTAAYMSHLGQTAEGLKYPIPIAIQGKLRERIELRLKMADTLLNIVNEDIGRSIEQTSIAVTDEG